MHDSEHVAGGLHRLRLELLQMGEDAAHDARVAGLCLLGGDLADALVDPVSGDRVGVAGLDLLQAPFDRAAAGPVPDNVGDALAVWAVSGHAGQVAEQFNSLRLLIVRADQPPSALIQGPQDTHWASGVQPFIPALPWIVAGDAGLLAAQFHDDAG